MFNIRMCSRPAGLLVKLQRCTASPAVPTWHRKVSNMQAEKLKAIVFLCSTRKGPSFMGMGSWGDKIGSAMRDTLTEYGFEVSLWDPKANDYQVLTQAMDLVPDNSIFPEWMHEKRAELEGADAFVVCCAEYNCALPPALTNMMDYYPPAAYRHRPVALLTYSVSDMGGVRIQPPLKTFVTELGMVPIPTLGKVCTVQDKFTEEGAANDERMQRHMVDQAEELRWYANAIKKEKAVTEIPALAKKSA